MIDRKSLVTRHNPKITKVEPYSPLSIGNGEFAFSADITGLQSFPESYHVPLGTQSHWGWHSSIEPDHYSFKDIRHEELDTYGRKVAYPLYPEDKKEAYHWLRQNPHRLHLGQLSFILIKENGERAEVTDLQQTEQELNLWNGCLYSEFELEGVPVQVITAVHGENDQVGVKVISPLTEDGRLQVTLKFPAPDMFAEEWDECVHLDWGNPDRHETKVVEQSEGKVVLQRTLDKEGYEVSWTWSHGTISNPAPHEYLLIPPRNSEITEFTFTVAFGKNTVDLTDVEELFRSSHKYWEGFWISGGAIDLSGSEDPRADELERRVVLSQFLTAIHSAGSLPPQETGLMYNSWFGKFHLEMHWWHGAHFPLWGRSHLLEKSLHWYNEILPLAKSLAESQGYEGARWPKQVGPDGKQSPSMISPVLIWQQPHPIALAELCYQAQPVERTLDKWKDLVFETAQFMSSFAVWDSETQRYVLGPPLIPAQENHKPEESLNPTFELEYWKHGLELAMKWAERTGVEAPSKWRKVAEGMAKPTHKDGVYLAHESCPETFTKYNHDHPSMVGALGILPGALIDKGIMLETLKQVKEEWQWDTAWGWDFPMCAMTAARLGEPQLAVDFLLMEAKKNTYLPNGHNFQRDGLTAYLPGNGGLLTAVAMMACAWQGADIEDAPDVPGFPKEWNVTYEGLYPFL